MRGDADTQAAVKQCRKQLSLSTSNKRVVFGFDGIIDSVRVIIEGRRAEGGHVPVTELETISRRISASTEKDSSATFEWVTESTRTGGHVCHLTRALGTLQYNPTMIGTFGDPIKPIFKEEFGQYHINSIGQPGYTDAVEFNDGKLMLTESGEYRTLNWETLCDRIGIEELASYVDESDLFGIGYWSTTPALPDVLRGLAEELWPILTSPPDHVFVDPGDLRNINSSDLKKGTTALSVLNDSVSTTVSANRVETQNLAHIFDSSVENQKTSTIVARKGLGVDRFASHSIDCSVVSTAEGTVAVDVPRTTEPVLTTSAGDHFNAGLVCGILAGMDERASLVVANSVAGWFVRNGYEPNREQLSSFIDAYLSYFDSA